MLRKYSKKISKIRRKTKKQKGGFYPSIYDGVARASLLAFAAATQGYRLWSNSKKRKTRKQ
jgi:hypothetical protein